MILRVSANHGHSVFIRLRMLMACQLPINANIEVDEIISVVSARALDVEMLLGR